MKIEVDYADFVYGIRLTVAVVAGALVVGIAAAQTPTATPAAVRHAVATRPVQLVAAQPTNDAVELPYSLYNAYRFCGSPDPCTTEATLDPKNPATTTVTVLPPSAGARS